VSWLQLTRGSQFFCREFSSFLAKRKEKKKQGRNIFILLEIKGRKIGNIKIEK
jgi:hypothetical protein